MRRCVLALGLAASAMSVTVAWAADIPTVRIGYLVSLTGNVAEYGRASQQGADIAVAHLNASGKVKVEVLVQDDQSTAAGGLAGLNYLVSQGVKVVMGPAASVVGVPIAPVANRDKVVLISPYVSAPQFTSKGGYTFRHHMTAAQTEYAFGTYLAKKHGSGATAAILGSETPNSRSGSKAFQEGFEKAGGKVVAFEVAAAQATDYRTPLAKIKSSNPDILYMFPDGVALNALAVKQARSLGIKAKIAATSIITDASFIRDAGPDSEGVMYSTEYFDPKSSKPVIAEFVKEYEKRYNTAPVVWAGNAYDVVLMAVQAVLAVGNDGTKVREWLYQMRGWSGVGGGDLSFDEYGDPKGRSQAVGVIKDGKYVVDDTFSQVAMPRP